MKAAAQRPAHAPGRPAARPAARTWRYADKLINCPWCSGFWIGASAVAAYFRCWLGYWPHTAPTWFAFTTGAFACSWAAAILADWLDSPPPPTVIQLTPAHLDVTTRQGPPAP